MKLTQERISHRLFEQITSDEMEIYEKHNEPSRPKYGDNVAVVIPLGFKSYYGGRLPQSDGRPRCSDRF